MNTQTARPKHIVVIGDVAKSNRTRAILDLMGNFRITEAMVYGQLVAVEAADLLLLDYVAGGECCAHWIRRIRGGCVNQRRDIPIIVLTDSRIGDRLEISEVGQSMLAGATACVGKPVSARKLVFAVRDCLACAGWVTGGWSNPVPGRGLVSTGVRTEGAWHTA